MMPQTDLHTQLGDQRNFWNRKGLMLILSSPSGAGKTSVSRAILAQDDNISLSISVTTRPARPAEIDSHHYHFITQSEFVKMRDHQELLEWAHVFGNYYGTPRAPVEQTLANGKDVLFDIEWQGTQQLVEKAPADVVKVFLLPPSRATLLQRLQDR
ncbi:MAG: guanylate kinase, partial [Pseudomonadota bacterium]